MEQTRGQYLAEVKSVVIKLGTQLLSDSQKQLDTVYLSEMALQIGDTAPDFEAETTEGRISFHDWIGDSWAVLFSHPRDFTPVCTTELGYMAKAKPEFDNRNTKIVGLSVDPMDNHEKWVKDIEETQGAKTSTAANAF